ncbi:MAG TPA: ComEC/Rec2 family competence protein [Candidatus Magasanikbacteria bacterium]|nr:ComEC/Rec2 family competence protein [Candidatus Magasanikbacteria bacterium]
MFLEKIVHSQSKFFLAVLISFGLGVAVASWLKISRTNLFWLVEVLVGLIIVGVIIQSKKWRVFIVLVIFLFLGWARFVFSEPVSRPDNLRFYVGRLVYLKGRMVSNGEISGNYQRIYFQTSGFKFFSSDNYQVIRGKTVVYLDKYPLYSYGEELALICNLVDPQELTAEEKFSYAEYLNKEGVWSACFNAKLVERISDGRFSFYKFLLNLKNYFNQKINYFLPEPHSSFLRGLLYGDRASIPDDLKEAFSRTGVTHIVAISGYNITVIMVSLLAVLKFFKISRRRAFGIIIAVIIFFVFLTGASASVVRAGLMGVVVLWGRQGGRKAQAGRILILTATLMLLINPRLLFFDAGFQLSFLSTIGLIYFSPILEKRIIFLPDWLGLKEIILTTFSAIIFTLPLIIYIFGRFSLIAPMANLLILPAVPLAMLAGFIFLLASIIYLPLGQFFSYIIWAVLSYIIKVAEILSSWKFSAINLSWSWWLMILFYLFLIYLVYVNYQKQKN